MSVTTAFAVAYAAATTGVAAFQLALALGAPWGAYAMGGSVSGSFPPAMRVVLSIRDTVEVDLAERTVRVDVTVPG